MPTLITVSIILFVVLLTMVPFVRFFLRGRANVKLRASGTRTQAQILHVQRTGLQVNNQPQLQITALVIEGQGSFQVVMKEVISLAQISQFSPGQTISIVYQRTADGIDAALDATGGADDIITKSQELLMRLNATGLPAIAVVTQFTPTGVVVNVDNLLVKLDVSVQGPSGAFPSVIYGVFGSSGLHKYQPGKQISVRYDPQSLQECTVDISKTDTERVGAHPART